MSRQPTIAILGGGIFGTSCALELSKSFHVTLFERKNALLAGATTANHNRHHYGFHYPRSSETILQVLESRGAFERRYGNCLDWDFHNYYCVAKKNTKTTPADYKSVMEKHGLEFREEYPPAGAVDRSKLALSLRVKEGVYDIGKLKKIMEKKFKKIPQVKIRLNHDVEGGRLEKNGKKILRVSDGTRVREEEFDYVINATYAHTNRFCEWFGFKKRNCQFNLQELDVVKLPLRTRIGVTIQDGPFPSIIPIANSDRYLMAHVNESQLVREVSSRAVPLLSRANYVESNWNRILETCAEYLPILKKATYVKSIFVDRVVDAARLNDDARLSETTFHGNGCWSIFSAKVITCVTTAEKMHAEIRHAAGMA